MVSFQEQASYEKGFSEFFEKNIQSKIEQLRAGNNFAASITQTRKKKRWWISFIFIVLYGIAYYFSGFPFLFKFLVAGVIFIVFFVHSWATIPESLHTENGKSKKETKKILLKNIKKFLGKDFKYFEGGLINPRDARIIFAIPGIFLIASLLSFDLRFFLISISFFGIMAVFFYLIKKKKKEQIPDYFTCEMLKKTGLFKSLLGKSDVFIEDGFQRLCGSLPFFSCFLKIIPKRGNVFSGQLIWCSVPRRFSGKTYCFSGENYCGEGEKISLESLEFEKDFEVVSTNPLEARAIFSPVFMEKVLNLKIKSVENIGICFIENGIFLVINKSRNPFNEGSEDPLEIIHVFLKEVHKTTEIVKKLFG